jgi:prepilin-type processing-associated H-X9-DG protein
MQRRVNVVVLGLIVLIGAGLLFTAVNKLREADRRAQCNNNLMIIGSSFRNYLESNGCFPPGTVPNKVLPPEKRLSWMVETYPYIEAVWFRFDRDKAWDAEENLVPNVTNKTRGTPKERIREKVGECRLFRCPGNPNKAEPGRPGLSHYVGIAGVGKNAAELSLRTADESAIRRDVGFFGYDRTIKPEDIKDGLATTLAVAETRADNGPWTAGGPSTVRNLDPQNLPYLRSEGQFGGIHHAGGAMVLFVDGSTRFIRESISPEVFEALATIAGGEELGNEPK